MIEQQVLDALKRAPASGGVLLERLHLDVRVYGALANLAARGEIEVVGEGPGERVFGVHGTLPAKPRAPGLPASISLTDEELGEVDGRAARVTGGLPGHYFEEMRRALIAHCDRARKLHLDVFGREKPVRRFLRRVERGAPVRLRLHSPVRWIGSVVLGLVVIALLRFFVVGVYTVPSTSISMAPALFPAAEGGDAIVLANLLARTPARGEIWIFRRRRQIHVKRIMGLPGERIEVRDGDLFVDGKRLVKERSFLDRVKVPLPGLDSIWPGYPRPDGTFERLDKGRVRDVVFSARIHARSLPASVMVKINNHVVLIGPKGFASSNGVEIESGLRFALMRDPVELWITNADGVFRVEIDGKEVARTQIETPAEQAIVEMVTDGEVDVDDLLLARDLRYGPVENFTWTLKEDEIFVLGDNSANSADSRRSGPVKVDALLGRVWAVAWPLSRIRRVR